MPNEISLALSGGGMRGCAHIGALKKLEELNFTIRAVAGTSVGAIVGAFIADGFRAKEIEELFIRSKFSFDVNYFKLTQSLFSSKRIEALLKNNLRSKRFEDLDTEFYVCVTNYKNGKPEYLHSGDLVKSVLASAAIPMVYHPVTINDQIYVDGGVTRNLPTDILIPFAFPIVGVHVNPIPPNPSNQAILEKLDYNIHLSLLEKLEISAGNCAVFIEPEKLVDYSLFDTKHIPQLIQIGYDKAAEVLAGNKSLNVFRNH